MDGLAAAVCHLDAERRERIAVVGLFVEEADRLFDERVKAFFCGEVCFITGNARPEERRHIHRVVSWLTLHQCELAAHVVADTAEFLLVLAPRQDVAMTADGGKPEAVCLVQVFVNPLLVDLIGATVTGERVHVPCVLLEALQILRTVVNQHILVVDMAARQQQPHGSGKGEAAVAAVGGQAFIAHIRTDQSGQVFRIGEGMQAEPLVADTHPVGSQINVLQDRRVGERQREILLYQSRFFFRADNLFIAQSGKANKAALVHNPLELPGGFEELAGGILVPYLLGDDMSPAEGGEVALLPVAVLGRLGQEQVAGVIQERSLIEVSLETAGGETHILLLQVRTVALLDKPILLVYDAVGRQHLDCLYPRRMDRGILRTRHRIKFGKLDPKGDRNVGVFREDTALFDGK